MRSEWAFNKWRSHRSAPVYKTRGAVRPLPPTPYRSQPRLSTETRVGLRARTAAAAASRSRGGGGELRAAARAALRPHVRPQLSSGGRTGVRGRACRLSAPPGVPAAKCSVRVSTLASTLPSTHVFPCQV